MPSFFCLVFEIFRGSGQALAARAVALPALFACVCGDIVGEWKVEKQIVKIAGFFLLSKLFILVRNKAI